MPESASASPLTPAGNVGQARLPSLDPSPSQRSLRVQVAVVGAGPAGVAAALAAAEAGRSVALVDEGFRAGGQIWRHAPGQAPPEARRMLAQLATSGVRVLARSSAFDAWRDGDRWGLAVSTPEARQELRADALVLACGAREIFIPFPGWTLPGVMGAGGGQAMLKEGLDLKGDTVVVAGTGPLLLPVAATVRKSGGRLLRILEQAPLRRLLGMVPLLAARPAKARQALSLAKALFGVPYKPGWWVAQALGSDRLEAVRITDGTREETLSCRWLFCGFNLVPNLELGRVLGCALNAGGIAVDEHQATSLPGVFAVGEVCGVAGVDAALSEGRIAGLAASLAFDPASPEGLRLSRERAKARAMGTKLEELFAPREELHALARPDTLVCRCEDVRLGALDPTWSIREAKLCTRAGMGPCQARVCGPILAHHLGHNSIQGGPPGRLPQVEALDAPEAGGLCVPPDPRAKRGQSPHAAPLPKRLPGHNPDTVRIPVKSVPLGHLISEES